MEHRLRPEELPGSVGKRRQDHAVRVFDPAVGGDAQDELDGVLDQVAQPILALLQRRLHLRPVRDLPNQPVVRILQVSEDLREGDGDRPDRVVTDQLHVPEVVGVHRRALEKHQELVHLLPDVPDERGPLLRQAEVLPAKPLRFLDDRRHRSFPSLALPTVRT